MGNLHFAHTSGKISGKMGRLLVKLKFQVKTALSSFCTTGTIFFLVHLVSLLVSFKEIQPATLRQDVSNGSFEVNYCNFL